VRPDLIAVVEAAYRIDLADDVWIEQVARAASPLLDEGLGVAGYLVRLADGGGVLDTPVLVGRGDPWAGRWRSLWWDRHMARIPKSFIVQLSSFGSPAYASESCGALARKVPVARLATRLPPLPLPTGVREGLVVTGFDASGVGAALFAFRQSQASAPVAGSARVVLSRLSGHLAAAMRLRALPGQQREQARDAGPGGAELRAAIRRIDRARLRRNRASEEALDLWPALQPGGYSVLADGAGRWTALANPPTAPPLEHLTPRQRQAVALLGLGRSNKAIAYEMGIAPSTVSTLLSAAARRLSARNTAELIARTYLAVQTSIMQPPGPGPRLTEAEAAVLALLRARLSDSAIASVRRATRGTITKQIDSLYRKLQVGSRRELLARASSIAPWKGPAPADS
jgi:DNA-binding NarL/FixJ family response regulator